MSVRKIRLGIAGLGRAFSLMLPTLVLDPRIEIVAGADPRAEARARFEQDFSGRSYANVADMCADPGVEAVYVSTPHQYHVENVLAAAGHGRHILCEKPMALSVEDCQAMIDAARNAGVHLVVGHSHSFDGPIRRAREIVDAGEIGPLMFLRARYGHGGRIGYEREWRADPALSGGGELIDQGVHVIDLAGWFLGDFSRVEGHVATYFWNMPVDDNAFVSLRTAGGQTAWLHVSCTEWKNLFSLELYGRTGKLAIDGLGGSYGVERLTYYRMRPEMGPPDTTVWEFPRGDDSWERESAAFIDDIRTGREPSPGLAEGLRTLRVVEEVYRLSAPGSGSPTSSATSS